MCIKIEKEMSKQDYREIVSQAIIETGKLLEMSPEMTMYHSIYNQLIDINEKVIKNSIVFSDREIYGRYSLGALATKNFDIENDEYAQKLSDSFGGMFDYHEMPEKCKEKLFDGDEDNCLQEIFEVGNQKIKLTDFYNNPLSALKNEIGEESFNLLIQENKFNQINNFIKKYTSENGFEVYFLKRNDFIYLFSYGEYQSGRYILYLEGIGRVRTKGGIINEDTIKINVDIEKEKTILFFKISVYNLSEKVIKSNISDDSGAFTRRTVNMYDEHQNKLGRGGSYISPIKYTENVITIEIGKSAQFVLKAKLERIDNDIFLDFKGVNFRVEKNKTYYFQMEYLDSKSEMIAFNIN